MDEERQSGLARLHTAATARLSGNVVAIAATAAVILALGIAVASVDRAASPLARCVSLEGEGRLGEAIGACAEAADVGRGSKSATVASERLDILRPRLAAIEYARYAEGAEVPDVVTEAWCDRLKERLLDRYLTGELVDQAGKKYSMRHPASHLREVISEHLDNEVVSCKDDAGKPTAGYWQCKWNSTNSNYNQCRRSSERRARSVADDTTEAAPQPRTGAVAASIPRAQEFMRQWLQAQNIQDFETYRSLYAPTFVGVKRAGETTREYRLVEWLDDRRGMFAKGFTVTADGDQVEATSTGLVVTFTQEWRSANYADRGTKRLVLKENGGRMLITREELLTSERISTARASTEAPAGTNSTKAPSDATAVSVATKESEREAGRAVDVSLDRIDSKTSGEEAMVWGFDSPMHELALRRRAACEPIGRVSYGCSPWNELRCTVLANSKGCYLPDGFEGTFCCPQ